MRRKIHGDEGDVRTEKCQGRLTVYFEDPFWVGVFERIENGKISAAKVTFGAEPKDYEVQEYIIKYYYRLQFSPAITTDVKDAKKKTMEAGIGTKSQQALKLEQEQNKLARKERSKKEREEESDRLFEMKQQKKKEKHKGH